MPGIGRRCGITRAANRGEGCFNTTIATPAEGGKYKGGCYIWYDEPSLLRAIETHLGQSLPTLESTTYGKKREEASDGQREGSFLERERENIEGIT